MKHDLRNTYNVRSFEFQKSCFILMLTVNYDKRISL